MDTIYWRLLVLCLNYLMVHATCNMTTTYGEEYDRHCYHCRNRLRQIEKGPRIYTCFSTSILEVNNADKNNPFDTSIFLMNSSISTLDPKGYSWKRIMDLRIQDTNTSKIIPGFFNNFDNLKVLHITNNKITEIVSGVFSSATALETLNLTENLISTIAEHSFSGLLNLKILDLSKNKIMAIPQRIFEYQNFISYVDLSQNMIKDIGTVFNKLSLETINLNQNRLIDFDFHQLQSNHISKIDLSNNMIEHIGINNDDIISADEISLSKNKIKVLPKIRDVKILNISHNYIQQIGDNILGSTVETIDISNNNIIVLTEKAFENLTSLEYLKLDHNNLKILAIDALVEVKNLKHLDVSFNHISQIQFGLFNNLNELTYLDISDNDMSFDFHTLSTLTSLKVLKFRNNRIINFDTEILLTRFTNLETVTLSDNSWNCSELASTVHRLQLKKIEITHGQNTKVSNILGISCKDHVNLKEDSILFQRSNDEAQDRISNVQNYPVKLFDDSLKNTTFFKYLESVVQYVSQNYTASSPSMGNNKFIQYLNQNFSDTNFYKFMQNLKELGNGSLDTFAEMRGFFNEGFNNSNFFKYINSLENNFNRNLSRNTESIFFTSTQNKTEILLQGINSTLSDINENIKQLLLSQNVSLNEFFSNMNKLYNIKAFSVGTNIESRALTGVKSNENKAVEDYLILVNVLLILILCCLSTVGYRTFYKPKKQNSSLQEQVQLM